MKKWLERIGWMDVVLLSGILMITLGLGLSISGKDKESKLVVERAKTSPTPISESKKIVDVGGGVIRPGVYRLEGDARVMDALIAAGGLNQIADREWVDKNINKAERVRDGQKIYIPEKTDGSQSEAEKILNVMGSGNVNLNTADEAELDSLEGVGPSLAKKIIAYREEKGGFRDINELKLVSGIGEKMFEKIKDKVGL